MTIFPETQRFCSHYHLDPLGLIASGALLIIVELAEAGKVMSRLRQEKDPAFVIGEVVPRRQGGQAPECSGLNDLIVFDWDEMTKVLQ